MSTKQTILDALYKFVSQRPGLEFGNYGDLSAYRSEMRSITRDLQHARTLIRAVELLESITAEDLVKAAEGAFSGRLSINVRKVHSKAQQVAYEGAKANGGIAEMPPPDSERVEIDYCTGQYWPTEYRRAACAVLASALWSYWRDCMPASDETARVEKHGYSYDVDLYKFKGRKVSADDWLRGMARDQFGRGIAQRWFN